MSDSEIVALMWDSDEPAFTASEIADEVGMTKDGVYNRLQELYEAGEIEKKKPQPTTVIWWVQADGHCPAGR